MCLVPILPCVGFRIVCCLTIQTPGHKRSSRVVASPVSLRPPTCPPRSNRATDARLQRHKDGLIRTFSGSSSRARASYPNSENSFTLSHSASTDTKLLEAVRNTGNNSRATSDHTRERKEVDFSSCPGHRRSSIQGLSPIASLRPPSIVPKSNLSSQVRLQAISHNGSSASHNMKRPTPVPPAAHFSPSASLPKTDKGAKGNNA